MNAVGQDNDPSLGLEPENWLRVDTENEQLETYYYKYETEVPVTHLWQESPSRIIEIDPCLQDENFEITFPLLDYVAESDASKVLQTANDSVGQIVKPTIPRKRKVRKEKEQKEVCKRTRQPETWKVNIVKNARLKGLEYVGIGGKIVPAKEMGPPCNCRISCNKKVNEEARKNLHDTFWKTWNWEQRKQYIACSVTESPKRKTQPEGTAHLERRKVTFTYTLLIKDEFVTVCKSMFLSTFSVSEKFVRHVMEKKRTSPGGIIGPDLRGKHTPKTKKSEAVKEIVRRHIRSFPTESSSDYRDGKEKRYLDANLNIATMYKLYVKQCQEEGLPESDIVKKSYYREIFKTEFNLGFKDGANDKIEMIDKEEFTSCSNNEHNQ